LIYSSDYRTGSKDSIWKKRINYQEFETNIIKLRNKDIKEKNKMTKLTNLLKDNGLSIKEEITLGKKN